MMDITLTFSLTIYGTVMKSVFSKYHLLSASSCSTLSNSKYHAFSAL